MSAQVRYLYGGVWGGLGSGYHQSAIIAPINHHPPVDMHNYIPKAGNLLIHFSYRIIQAGRADIDYRLYSLHNRVLGEIDAPAAAKGRLGCDQIALLSRHLKFKQPFVTGCHAPAWF